MPQLVQSFVLCSCGEEEEEANVELVQTGDKGPASYLAQAITHLESNFMMEEEDANTASAGEMTFEFEFCLPAVKLFFGQMITAS